MILENNEPTKIVVANLEMNKQFEVLDGGDDKAEYILQPFDNVAVRFIKDFDFRSNIIIH